MANIPYPHSLPGRRSGDFSTLKTTLFYLLLASLAIAIAVPAAIATIGAQ